MKRDEIIEKLIPIASSIFMKQFETLTDDMSAETVDTWTSLSFMQLLTEIESQFSFKFKMMEVLRLKTMGDILNAMEQHLA